MWSSDFEIAPGESFGEWLHDEIERGVVLEEHGFMADRVRAAAARLQATRPDNERFVVAIPWLDEFTAFTGPGRYIYFSRRLLERCPHEEAAAFVIAHEIAHHDLGHLAYFRGSFAGRAARVGAGLLLVLFFRLLQKRIYSPERELDADRGAMDLCVAAGYDPGRCLYLFHILELIALDLGDLGAVYGLDPGSDQELAPEASAMTKARIWLYQRRRGYLPIQDRQAALQRYLRETRGVEIHPRGA